MSTPPPILGILTAGGFGCRAEGERLIVHPADGLTDALRAMIRAAKTELLAYLAANDSAPIIEAEIADDIPRRCWWIMDGRRTFTATYTPPITLAEVRAEYPGAIILEDDDDDH